MCFKIPCFRLGFEEVVAKKICIHMNFFLTEKLFIIESPSIAEQFNICTRHLRPQKGLPSTIFVLHKNIVEFTGLVMLIFNNSIKLILLSQPCRSYYI